MGHGSSKRRSSPNTADQNVSFPTISSVTSSSSSSSGVARSPFKGNNTSTDQPSYSQPRSEEYARNKTYKKRTPVNSSSIDSPSSALLADTMPVNNAFTQTKSSAATVTSSSTSSSSSSALLPVIKAKTSSGDKKSRSSSLKNFFSTRPDIVSAAETPKSAPYKPPKPPPAQKKFVNPYKVPIIKKQTKWHKTARAVKSASAIDSGCDIDVPLTAGNRNMPNERPQNRPQDSPMRGTYTPVNPDELYGAATFEPAAGYNMRIYDIQNYKEVLYVEGWCVLCCMPDC